MTVRDLRRALASVDENTYVEMQPMRGKSTTPLLSVAMDTYRGKVRLCGHRPEPLEFLGSDSGYTPSE